LLRAIVCIVIKFAHELGNLNRAQAKSMVGLGTWRDYLGLELLFISWTWEMGKTLLFIFLVFSLDLLLQCRHSVYFKIVIICYLCSVMWLILIWSSRLNYTGEYNWDLMWDLIKIAYDMMYKKILIFFSNKIYF
jgi:hypothetical protein